MQAASAPGSNRWQIALSAHLAGAQRQLVRDARAPAILEQQADAAQGQRECGGGAQASHPPGAPGPRRASGAGLVRTPPTTGGVAARVAVCACCAPGATALRGERLGERDAAALRRGHEVTVLETAAPLDRELAAHVGIDQIVLGAVDDERLLVVVKQALLDEPTLFLGRLAEEEPPESLGIVDDHETNRPRTQPSSCCRTRCMRTRNVPSEMASSSAIAWRTVPRS